MKHYSIRYSLLATLMLSIGNSAWAGQPDSTIQVTPATLNREKSVNLWQQTNNAAGLTLERHITYSYADLSYDMMGGNFRRPQQPRKDYNFNFQSEGNLQLGKTRLWGYFGYRRQTAKDVEYNASILDPYRGMPYYTADTVPSNWHNSFYKLGFKVAQPLGRQWAIGIEGWYKAADGAKQRDPRTENEVMQLILRPSVIFNISDKHHLGVDFEYEAYKEESDMDNLNYRVDQVYYYLYGLGVAEEDLGSGRNSEYKANKVGGDLQYEYSGWCRLLLEGGYHYKVEDLHVGLTTSRKEGTTRDHLWNVSLKALRQNNLYTHILHVGYQHRQIDGIQYVNQYNSDEDNAGWVQLYSNVRSKYRHEILQANYQIMRNRGDEYVWSSKIGVVYLSDNDKYMNPLSELKNKNICYQWDGDVNINICKRHTGKLLIGALLAYQDHLSGHYTYGGTHPEYAIVTDLMTRDFDCVTTNWWKAGLSAVYSQRVAHTKAFPYIRLDYNYAHATSTQLAGRSDFHVSVGCNF